VCLVQLQCCVLVHRKAWAGWVLPRMAYCEGEEETPEQRFHRSWVVRLDGQEQGGGAIGVPHVCVGAICGVLRRGMRTKTGRGVRLGQRINPWPPLPSRIGSACPAAHTRTVKQLLQQVRLLYSLGDGQEEGCLPRGGIHGVGVCRSAQQLLGGRHTPLLHCCDERCNRTQPREGCGVGGWRGERVAGAALSLLLAGLIWGAPRLHQKSCPQEQGQGRAAASQSSHPPLPGQPASTAAASQHGD
jgi:hypothetical protein